MCGPNLQTRGNKLRVLVRVDFGHFAPPRSDDVNAVVSVGGTVGHVLHSDPPHDHSRVPWEALHPHILNRETQCRRESAEPFEPASQPLTIMPLAAKCVMAAEPVIDVR